MSQHHLLRLSCSAAMVLMLSALGCGGGNDDQQKAGEKDAGSGSPDAYRKADVGSTPSKADSAGTATPDGNERPADGKPGSLDTASPNKDDAQTPDRTGDALSADTRPRPDGSPAPDTQPGTSDTGGSSGSSSVQFQGRFDFSDTSTPGAASFGWTGSALVARFQGTGIEVNLESGNQFAVIIDGKPTTTVIKASTSTKKYTVATGLSAGTHDLVLWQRSESNWSADRFTGFTVQDGQMLAPPSRPDRRIEIYGDSITAGYGIEGNGPSCKQSPDNSNSYLAYGAVTARALNAELHSVAWSGIGMYRGYGETTESASNMLTVYTLTTPTGKDASGKSLAPWDFSSWQPDAVVINLGTNDISSGDPGTGFRDNYLKFVTNLRQHYPKTFFVLAAGPMLNDSQLKTIKAYLQEVMKDRAAAGDSKMSYLEFPTQDANDGLGCDWHPGVTTNAKMSALLVAELKKQLGW